MKKIIYIFCILLSCAKEKQISRETIRNVSISYLGQTEYYNIIKLTNDTLDYWLKKNPSKFKMTKKYNIIKLDDIICVNTDKNKFIMVELHKSLNSPLDVLVIVNGIKIKNKWYLFYGGNLVLPKYEESSLESLKKVAFDAVYKGYLFVNKNGKLQINEHFFDNFTDNSWRSNTGIMPWDKESWDQLYLETATRNWSKIDSVDYSKE